MRHARLSILAGTAVALVMAAATTAGANPNYPSVGERNAPSRDAGTAPFEHVPAFRCDHPLPRGDAAAELSNAAARRADHLDAELPAATPAEPVNAPLRMIAPRARPS